MQEQLGSGPATHRSPGPESVHVQLRLGNLNTEPAVPSADAALGGENRSLRPDCEHSAIIKPEPPHVVYAVRGLDKSPVSCLALVDDISNVGSLALG